jgi:rare lipoprotein A
MMVLACGALLLAGCGSQQSQTPVNPAESTEDSAVRLARAVEPGYKIGRPYRIAGQWYNPKEQFDLVQSGVASWYGPGFHGRLTANGERYDMHAFTAAHRTLQLPSVVQVENLENGRSIIVRVNDRGPYIDGRVIDLSRKAAEALDVHKKGLAKVQVTVLPEQSRRIALMARRGASVGEMDDLIGALNRDPQSVKRLSAEPPRPPVRVASSRPQGTLFLQAAAFSNQDYAERARTMLRTVGPVSITEFARGDRTLYRVRVGPYADRNEALTALERVREVGFEGAHLLAKG